MSKPNWEKIREEWETTKITFKDLAEKHDVKDSTIRSRKNREKWQRNKTDNATQRKRNVATKKKIKEPVVESDNLTDKQRLFCIYYIKYFNATKAYQKAYECDYVSAMTNGSRMLRNDKVSDEIDRLRKDKLSEKKLSVSDVLQKYIDIAFADIGDYVERGDEGYSVTVKPLDQMDTSIISELSNTENGIKLKLSDKMKALDMLAKFTDLLSDKQLQQLQQEKIKTEIAKTKAETKNEESGTGRVVIVNDKEAMRKAMQNDSS